MAEKLKLSEGYVACELGRGTPETDLVVYRTEGSGVLLYSVGPDRSDHGGEARRSGKNRDLVWRVERPAQ